MENQTYKNNVEITGFISNVKTYGKLLTFSVAMGVKQQDGTYKNGFFNCKTGIDKVSVKKGDKVTANGFMSFDFWDKGDGKEGQKPVLVVQTIDMIEEAKEEGTSSEPKAQENNSENEPAGDDTDLKEVPF